MHKIRYYLVAIALLASLSGFSFLRSGSLANTTFSHQISAISIASVVGKSPRLVAFTFRAPCPSNGSDDC